MQVTSSYQTVHHVNILAALVYKMTYRFLQPMLLDNSCNFTYFTLLSCEVHRTSIAWGSGANVSLAYSLGVLYHSLLLASYFTIADSNLNICFPSHFTIANSNLNICSHRILPSQIPIALYYRNICSHRILLSHFIIIPVSCAARGPYP